MMPLKVKALLKQASISAKFVSSECDFPDRPELSLNIPGGSHMGAAMGLKFVLQS